MFINGVVIWKK